MVKTFIYDLIYVFLNSFVSHIPFWTIRKAIYILFGLKIGRGSRICMRTRIMEPWHIIIGKNTIVNEACILDGRGGLKIGNNCSVSVESILYTASHISDSKDFEYYEKNTEIGNGVWIGVRAVILPGAMVEDNVVIGACSVVTGGVNDSNSVYAGMPAKKKKSRNVLEIKDLNHKMMFR